MANHRSAQKRIRQTKVRTQRNRFYRTRIKNLTRGIREAVENGHEENAYEALKLANKNLQSYVGKGVLKKNTASRKISRLAHLVNTLKQPPTL